MQRLPNFYRIFCFYFQLLTLPLSGINPKFRSVCYACLIIWLYYRVSYEPSRCSNAYEQVYLAVSCRGIVATIWTCVSFGNRRKPNKKRERMMRPEPIEVFQRANITVRPSYRENTFKYTDRIFYSPTIYVSFDEVTRILGREPIYEKGKRIQSWRSVRPALYNSCSIRAKRGKGRRRCTIAWRSSKEALKVAKLTVWPSCRAVLPVTPPTFDLKGGIRVLESFRCFIILTEFSFRKYFAFKESRNDVVQTVKLIQWLTKLFEHLFTVANFYRTYNYLIASIYSSRLVAKFIDSILIVVCRCSIDGISKKFRTSLYLLY